MQRQFFSLITLADSSGAQHIGMQYMLVEPGLIEWWTAYWSCPAASHLAWCLVPSQDACSPACLIWAAGVCWCIMGAETLWAILGWARASVSSMYNPQREYILIAKGTKYTSYLFFTYFVFFLAFAFLFSVFIVLVTG